VLVAIDAGNSQTAIGVHDGREWRVHWRIASNRSRTVDETVVLVDDLFLSAAVRPSQCHRAVVSSVVPEIGPVMRDASARLFGVDPLVVAPGVRTGMGVRYTPAQSLGTDRLADAIAGRELVGAPVVVVDFGTATTFNVVGPTGDFVGGAIAPGIGTAASALAASGARLSRIGLREIGAVKRVGRNTAEAMRSGVLLGYAGLVEFLLALIEGELNSTARVPVIATGGHAIAMSPLVARIDRVEPLLTLDGLRIIAEMDR
jgi:type III pantothenate kinase